MLKKVLSAIVAVILGLSMILCCTVIIKSALGYDKSVFGFHVFYIVSGSMEPTIPTGAAVLVQKSDSYAVDDIITFESADSAIYGYPNTHRIIEVVEENGKEAFITKGDANPVADDYAVTEDAIYGKVVCSTGQMYWLGTLIGMITTPFGFITVILLPILAVIAILVHDFTKDYKAALVAEVEAMRNAEGMYVPQGTEVPVAFEQSEVPIVPMASEQTEVTEDKTSEQTEEIITTEQPEETLPEVEEPEIAEENVPDAEEQEMTEKDDTEKELSEVPCEENPD